MNKKFLLTIIGLALDFISLILIPLCIAKAIIFISLTRALLGTTGSFITYKMTPKLSFIGIVAGICSILASCAWLLLI